MIEAHRQEIETFIQRLFENNRITITEYSKTDAGVHVGAYYNYAFQLFNHDFMDNLPFHLNIFSEGGDWVFKPQLEQIHMITNIMDPVQHEAAEAKRQEFPNLAHTITANRAAIRTKMIEMNNDGRFDE